MKLLHRPFSAVGTTPLAAVELGLGLAAVPLFDQVAGWIIPLFFAAGVARLLMNRPGARLPSLPVKALLFGLGVGAIFLTYHSFVGVAPGLSALVLLVSLKLLETNTVRDFQVLALLGYFLALCDLFFTQTLGLWLYVAAVFTLLTAALVHFHRGTGTAGLLRSARLGGLLLAQALPVIALLFVFFPRSRVPFLQFSQPPISATGMSDRLEPGGVGSLALGDEVIFRAEFPDGNAPSMSAMYWRGSVLWRGDGLKWWRGPELPAERRQGQLGGAAIRQRIVLEPHGAHWLFALDRPATEIRGAFLDAGGFLQTQRPVLRQLQYEVFSRPDNRESTLPGIQRQATQRLPTRVSPQVQTLVSGWRTAHRDDRAVVDAALHHFRAEHFTYSLSPGTYGPDALHEFLFERRVGFCEHYAAAFASLMRLAGISSRVVIGYHGGEYNARGHYVTVRQSDAHAWCEVWLKGEGWLRVDPTEVIAPERISAGFAGFLENREAANPTGRVPSSARTGWREVRRELRLAWDNLSYQWDLRVLGFDDDSQRSVLANLGLGNFRWAEITFTLLVGSSLLLSALGLWQTRVRQPRRDPVELGYTRFCRVLAAAGVAREPWEGPLGFSERAAARFTSRAAAIREIAALYTRLRYAPTPPSASAFLQAVRAFADHPADLK
ncbi:MAG: DUF3488 and transglutaminase-like domain-containing protein [Chthoniobacter sp.]|nr:DUF3488 and transglutaminase-like domain-containing protein [Chthoniobacter sp.]